MPEFELSCESYAFARKTLIVKKTRFNTPMVGAQTLTRFSGGSVRAELTREKEILSGNGCPFEAESDITNAGCVRYDRWIDRNHGHFCKNRGPSMQGELRVQPEFLKVKFPFDLPGAARPRRVGIKVGIVRQKVAVTTALRVKKLGAIRGGDAVPCVEPD